MLDVDNDSEATVFYKALTMDLWYSNSQDKDM